MTYSEATSHLQSLGYTLHHTAKHPVYMAKDEIKIEHYSGRFGSGILLRKSAGIRCTYHIAEYWIKENET